MDQRIGQRLSDGRMNVRIVHAHHIFVQLERLFQISRQFIDDSEIKIKNIAAPVSVAAAHAIGPAGIRSHAFPVV